MPVKCGIEFAEADWDQSHQRADAVFDLKLSVMAFAEADLGRWILEHEIAVEATAHRSAFVEVA